MTEALDRLLAAAARARLSPSQVRILLRTDRRETTVPELAAALGEPPSAVDRAVTELIVRGLVRRRFDAAAGHEPVVVATAWGRLRVRQLTSSLRAPSPLLPTRRPSRPPVAS
jgi:DNA-binding MarR family transcriptional regulator